jgi:hypothetical protein
LEEGNRTLFEVITAWHCLQVKARGILGSGRDERLVSIDDGGGASPGTDGSERRGGVWSILRVDEEEEKSEL